MYTSDRAWWSQRFDPSRNQCVGSLSEPVTLRPLQQLFVVRRHMPLCAATPRFLAVSICSPVVRQSTAQMFLKADTYLSQPETFFSLAPYFFTRVQATDVLSLLLLVFLCPPPHLNPSGFPAISPLTGHHHRPRGHYCGTRRRDGVPDGLDPHAVAQHPRSRRPHHWYGKAQGDGAGDKERPFRGIGGNGGYEGLRWRQDSLRFEVRLSLIAGAVMSKLENIPVGFARRNEERPRPK